MGRKLLAILMMLLLILISTISVSAEEFDPLRSGAISVHLTEQSEKTPIAQAELSLYYIATVGINTDGILNYIYTEEFAQCQITIDDPALAQHLADYVSEYALPAQVVCTDEAGTARWTQLPLGMYLICQSNTVEGFAPCTPFVVTVPVVNGDSYEYEVNASPKTEVAKLTDITIEKVWNTDVSTKIADSVIVELIRGETVVESAVLSQANGWKVTWSDMPESDAYSVREVNVPNGFTATYKRNGYTFTVTNTSTLIQTGQLIWPIPVLGFAGLVLLALGFVLLRKKRQANA